MQPGDAFTGLSGDSSHRLRRLHHRRRTPSTPPWPAGGEGFDPVASAASAPPLLTIGGGSLGESRLLPATASTTQELQRLRAAIPGRTPLRSGPLRPARMSPTCWASPTLSSSSPAPPPPAGTPVRKPRTCRRAGSMLRRVQPRQRVRERLHRHPGHRTAAADTVTDTLVTPYGDINLDSLFGSIDAAAPLQPGDAFTGLEAGDSSIGADAFSIGSTTFDPITTGREPRATTPPTRFIGVPPLMEIGGGTPELPACTVWGLAIRRNSTSTAAPEPSATEIGKHRRVTEDVTQPVGHDQHRVHRRKCHRATMPRICRQSDRFTTSSTSATASRTSTPRSRASAGAADTVTDTLVTPWGDLNLDSLVAGIDAAVGAGSGRRLRRWSRRGHRSGTSAASAIDPLAFLGL